jgi:hypothetical protein
MVQSGSPCIVKLNGNRLAFRNNEALSVLVRVPPAHVPGERP